MDPITPSFLPLFILGILAGIGSGIFGIGGGIVIVPALMYVFGLAPKTATGTSLVVFLMPVGILGVIHYYRSGLITTDNLRFGVMIACGLVIGAFIGARIVGYMSPEAMRRAFSVLLIAVAIKLWLEK